MHRAGVHVVVLALVLWPVRIAAQPIRIVTDVRAELLQEQASGGGVRIELRNGARVSGVASRFDADRFEIDGSRIGYSSVAAFLDPATGSILARVERVQQPPPQRTYSTRVTVIVAAAIGAVLLWIKLLPSNW